MKVGVDNSWVGWNVGDDAGKGKANEMGCGMAPWANSGSPVGVDIGRPVGADVRGMRSLP